MKEIILKNIENKLVMEFFIVVALVFLFWNKVRNSLRGNGQRDGYLDRNRDIHRHRQADTQTHTQTVGNSRAMPTLYALHFPSLR